MLRAHFVRLLVALGHMKNDGKLDVNYLKGVMGDARNALLCAVGHNIRMILAHLQAGQLLRPIMHQSITK